MAEQIHLPVALSPSDIRGALINLIRCTDSLTLEMPTLNGGRLAAPIWPAMATALMPAIAKAGQYAPVPTIQELQISGIKEINETLDDMGGLKCSLDLPDSDKPQYYTLLQWNGYDPYHKDPHMVWRIGDGNRLGQCIVPSVMILDGLQNIGQ